MTLFVFKALHLIFMVTWFAGLFYIVRLFVYHSELLDRTADERKILEPQYQLMQRRLWYGITWPSLVLNLFFGIGMLFIVPGYLEQPWIHLKLGFVAGLVVYHLMCHRIFAQLQKGTVKYSSNYMRIWNEVATLFLVSVIFIATVGRVDLSQWYWGVVGLVLFAVLLMVAIRAYRKIRENKQG